MKMGTVSNRIFHALGKNRGQVMISMDDAKWHEAAMDAIGHMSNPSDWGVIRDAYFEKCNNLSAIIGFAVGVTMVCAAVSMSKIRARKREDEWIEATRCYVCLTGPALPDPNYTPDDINGMAVYLNGKIVGTVFQVNYSSDSERQSVYFSPIEEDWAAPLQEEWNNNRLNVTYDFGNHPGVYLTSKEKES